MLQEPECHKRKCCHFLGAFNKGSEATEWVRCTAFPDGIPEEIAFGSNLHLEPVPGDHGIQFELREETE